MKYFLLLFIFNILIKAEQPDTTLKKINQHKLQIEKAAKMFDVNPKYLSAIIYVERTLNYDWEDDALDVLLANAGVNSSIGFSQVKMKTAYWIETQLNDEGSIFFPEKKYKELLEISSSSEEIVKKLSIDSINILYAAAYLRIILSRWEQENFSLKDKPEILGTLYSTGLFYNDGTERKPNGNPKTNSFGKKVVKALNIILY